METANANVKQRIIFVTSNDTEHSNIRQLMNNTAPVNSHMQRLVIIIIWFLYLLLYLDLLRKINTTMCTAIIHECRVYSRI